ncbi:FtsK/SpoIIIE domain-containing protein [Brevibacterium sp. FAM 24638]|uniref:FtsK/SpoIIIE domain-containing protein n=1 Tax=Brevibacterium sp. FAM 24638 TaxID=3415681 RepID=UPI003C79796F
MSNPNTKELKLPAKFDPAKHAAIMERKVKEELGSDWSISHIDKQRWRLVAVRHTSMTSMNDEGETVVLELANGTKMSDAPAIAARFEKMKPGYYLTKFEPFLKPGRATMQKFDKATKRARGAVANALGVQPWAIVITTRSDGGYDLELPDSYTPSKHDEKVEEVATDIVGGPGWFTRIDPRSLEASIIPSDPPTFSQLIPYPTDAKVTAFAPGSKEWAKIPLGERLPAPGEKHGEPFTIDFESGMHSIVLGTSNSGKSVFLNDIVAGVLSRGAELAIIDTPAKAVDFTWCKKYVRPEGWGCESIDEAAAVMSKIYAEGDTRAKVLKKYDVQNWTQLPADAPEATTMRPIFLIMDEVTGLWALDSVPKGLDKDHPMRIEAQDTNTSKEVLKLKYAKTAAEMRFVGIKLVLSTQVASTDTGIGTALRTNHQNKILLGVNPTEGNRKLVFPDPAAVPKVPEHIRSNAKVGKGVGTAANEGDEACVFKPYFASPKSLGGFLERCQVPTFEGQRPTRATMEQFVPTSSPSDDGDETAKRRKKMEAEAMIDPETGEKMTPFEYANKQKRLSVRKGDADEMSGENQ